MSIYSTAANFPARAPKIAGGRKSGRWLSAPMVPAWRRLESSAGVQVWDIEKAHPAAGGWGLHGLAQAGHLKPGWQTFCRRQRK